MEAQQAFHILTTPCECHHTAAFLEKVQNLSRRLSDSLMPIVADVDYRERRR